MGIISTMNNIGIKALRIKGITMIILGVIIILASIILTLIYKKYFILILIPVGLIAILGGINYIHRAQVYANRNIF